MTTAAIKAALKDSRAYSLVRWWRDIRDVARWVQDGLPSPPPPIVKYRTIREYAVRYGIRTFVETGTYLGDAIRANIDQFSNICSIELSEELYRRAVIRFRHHRHVSILHGDSAVTLPGVVRRLTAPALFWLDGHYSGGVTACSDKESPIVEELEAVLASPQKHVVLIDDIRCFTGANGYPTVEALNSLVRERRPGYTFAVANDIARVTPG